MPAPEPNNVYDFPAPDYPPPEMQQAAVLAGGVQMLANGVGSTIQGVRDFLSAHRNEIYTLAVLGGTVAAVIYLPPLVTGSLKVSANNLREAWYGEGYADRWLEEIRQRKE